jgi:hypothetical protein
LLEISIYSIWSCRAWDVLLSAGAERVARRVQGVQGIVRGTICSAYSAPGVDLSGDVVGVASDAMDLLRGDRMEELETDEVEAGLRIDYPPLVERFLGPQHG